ncbi:MAG: UDP-N-acetylmuramoyl-L-alanine--D-glutamate ligase [Bilophila sp.]
MTGVDLCVQNVALPPAIKAGALAVVVGAGVSGVGAARLLHQMGARVRVLDRVASRIPDDFAAWATSVGVEIVCGEHTPLQFAGAALVVPSPGVAASVIRNMLPHEGALPEIMAETELAWRQLSGEPVLAVTGTSGKTTTTSLCAAMLEAQGLRVFTGGNIGTPLSEYVLSGVGGAKADVIVLELSSFQLQTCSTLHPRVAVLLNISENHLDYHADMAEYTSAKMQIFACQTANDTAVLHEGMDSLVSDYGLRARKIWYTQSERFPEMKLVGPHNRANAEAAWLACREFGVTEEAATRAVAAFLPLEHRLERVMEKGGVLYINDSKCTTVEALRVALESFDRPIVLLAGGKFKGGDLLGLLPLVRAKTRCVALYGASREHFEAAWQGAVPLSWDETLESAVCRAASLAHSGDVVLLAPATSSYDQYPNYLRRGEDFKRVVREVLA